MPTKPSYSITKPKGVSQAIDNFVTVGSSGKEATKPVPDRSKKRRSKGIEAEDTVVQTTIRLSARLHQTIRVLCLQRGTTLNELVVAHLLHVAKAETKSD